ncbi:MAG TPA: hypothetical protein VEW28_02005 [Candidatus Kapabacteria bacterium]|nr:hypothetical protein [Candidatus Kapabacteria bacterium]
MKLPGWLTAVLVFLTAGNPLLAQPMKWKVVAPNVLTPFHNPNSLRSQSGAIKVHNSTILAGWTNLVLSTDRGNSWRPLPIGNKSPVTDIDIYDDNTFAVVTDSSGVFYSSDQGSSWLKIQYSTIGFSIVFDGVPDRLIFSDNTSLWVISPNVSNVKIKLPLYMTVGSLGRAADGTLRALYQFDFGYPDEAALWFESIDHGSTWFQSGSKIFPNDGDDFSFICDQTDPNRFVMVHEDWALRDDRASMLQMTTNDGVRWTTPYKQPLGTFTNLNGNAATGCSFYFTGSQTAGILRSTDKGGTWTSIGGPVTSVDSRSISASDDAIIFAIDTAGSIWRTDPTMLPDSIFVSGDDFFNNLSLGVCDSEFDAKLFFFNAACANDSVGSAAIIGKDSLEFSISKGLSAAAKLPDSVVIHFKPSHSGPSDAKLLLTFSGGKTDSIDLGVTVAEPLISFSKLILFSGDTIDECSSLVDTVLMSVLCQLNISSVNAIGPDSSSFSLVGQSPSVLPRDSMLRILCQPKHTGKLSATIRIMTQDGRTLDIALAPFILPSPVTVTPSSLFGSDSILECVSITDTIRLTSHCSLLTFPSITIGGQDTSSFTISGGGSLVQDSMIIITCNAARSGKLQSFIHIVASDGRTWDIPLSPFIKRTPLVISRASLFSGDTIVQCHTSSDSLKLSALCPFNLSNISIAGVDATSFQVIGKPQASLPTDSEVVVECNPKRSGLLNANLHLTASDARTWDVPIAVYVLATPIITIAETQTTISDTIGGDVTIQITLHHSGAPTGAEFTLKYDTASLRYRGVFGFGNSDLTISHPSVGTARIAFNPAIDSILLAEWTYIPVDSGCAHITLDSVTAAGGKMDCVDIQLIQANAGAIKTDICSPPGCGRTAIGRLMKYGELPTVHIVPNPSLGKLSIRSQYVIRNAVVMIVDALGTVRREEREVTIGSGGYDLDLHDEPSGVYEVVVRTASVNCTSRFVLDK